MTRYGELVKTMPKMPMLSGLAPPTGVDIQQITSYSHIRKRRIVGRIKLKHDFVKHTPPHGRNNSITPKLAFQ